MFHNVSISVQRFKKKVSAEPDKIDFWRNDKFSPAALFFIFRFDKISIDWDNYIFMWQTNNLCIKYVLPDKLNFRPFLTMFMSDEVWKVLSLDTRIVESLFCFQRNVV